MRDQWKAVVLGIAAVLLAACAERPDGTRPAVSLTDVEVIDERALSMQRAKTRSAADQYGGALAASRDALAGEWRAVRVSDATGLYHDSLRPWAAASGARKQTPALAPGAVVALTDSGIFLQVQQQSP